MRLNRRNFFLAAGSALAGGAGAVDLSKMIVRSPRPQDLEMPLDGFHEWITPIDRFFIRTHTFSPDPVNLSEWKLKLDGVVNQPVTLSMADLKKLPRVELVAVLECAGNGRSFYQPRVPGAQWAFGSVGNGRWAGVRFRDVLAKAGLKDSAQQILLDGLDVPLGTMPDFQRTITVKKALDPDTLLAYEMNGQPLPIEHGFPLRLIVPGWAGDSWVKWLQHIEVLDHEFDGFWMKTAYRHPTRSVAPGTAVPPAEMVPVTDLNVKSVIAAPAGWTKPGPLRIPAQCVLVSVRRDEELFRPTDMVLDQGVRGKTRHGRDPARTAADQGQQVAIGRTEDARIAFRLNGRVRVMDADDRQRTGRSVSLLVETPPMTCNVSASRTEKTSRPTGAVEVSELPPSNTSSTPEIPLTATTAMNSPISFRRRRARHCWNI